MAIHGAKRSRGILVALAIVIALGLCAGAFIETRRMVWAPLRTAVTADDTALDGTTTGYTFQFADKPSTAMRLKPEDTYGELLFYGTAAADKVVNYKVYLYRANGPAVLWCNGTATTGTALRSSGAYYCDTITVTDVTGDATAYDGGGNNRVATLHLNNLRGYAWIFVEIDLPGTNPMTAASVEFSSY